MVLTDIKKCHTRDGRLTFGEGNSVSVEVVEPVHGPQGGLYVSGDLAEERVDLP
jgi:hypothetical protein